MKPDLGKISGMLANKRRHIGLTVARSNDECRLALGAFDTGHVSQGEGMRLERNLGDGRHDKVADEPAVSRIVYAARIIEKTHACCPARHDRLSR